MEFMARRYERGGATSSSAGRIRAPTSRRFRVLLRSEAVLGGVHYGQLVTRVWSLSRAYGFDVLIVLAAVESALEVAFRHDPRQEPRTTLWFAVPAIALVVLPLLARRRFRFAAPASVWLLAAALSFVDGRLVPFSASALVAGFLAAFLLGNLRDVVQARLGLAIVLSGAAIIVYKDPSHAPGEFVFTPLLFAIGWLAGFALRERAEPAFRGVCASTASPSRSRTRSTSLPIGSCRKVLPTRSSTRAPVRPRSSSGTAPTSSGSKCTTTAAARCRTTATGTASSASASASRSTAAR